MRYDIETRFELSQHGITVIGPNTATYLASGVEADHGGEDERFYAKLRPSRRAYAVVWSDSPRYDT